MSRFFPDRETWNPLLRIPEIKKVAEEKDDKLDLIFDEFYKKLNDKLMNVQNKAEAVRAKKDSDYMQGKYRKEKEYYPEWVGSRKKNK
jgi:hypothetical protein